MITTLNKVIDYSQREPKPLTEGEGASFKKKTTPINNQLPVWYRPTSWRAEGEHRDACGGAAAAVPVHEVVPVQRAEERVRRAGGRRGHGRRGSGRRPERHGGRGHAAADAGAQVGDTPLKHANFIDVTLLVQKKSVTYLYILRPERAATAGWTGCNGLQRGCPISGPRSTG